MSLTVELKHEGKKLEERLQPTLEAAEREATNAQKIGECFLQERESDSNWRLVAVLILFAIAAYSVDSR